MENQKLTIELDIEDCVTIKEFARNAILGTANTLDCARIIDLMNDKILSVADNLKSN